MFTDTLSRDSSWRRRRGSSRPRVAPYQDFEDDRRFHRRQRGGEGVHEDVEQSCPEVHVSSFYLSKSSRKLQPVGE